MGRVVKPASQRSRHLAPGDKLGKYDLIRQIAIGGMAELYLARTVGIEGFEKLVVIKRILPQHASNQSFVDMFLNEARLAATLQHPNVAQVYDIGMDEGDYFFAMEYVHGEDLDHLTTQANEQGVPLSMDASLTLVAHLCAGLHYAHEKVGADGKPLEIVHRDISPSNVLVSYDGAVKLVDFGIARATKKQTTTRGGLKGKIAYMSPEQCRSVGALDRRSDLFSVGMILYELTTGQLPFTGETEYQLLDQIVNRDVPPPSAIVPDYPPALEQILLRALARDRDRRYSTAVELQGHLEDFAHESRLRVSPLVLARLMSSLYPARLEEWAHAKAQGGFFVEQHVVRTLIEDGKTPPPNDPGLRAVTEAIKAHDAIVAAGGHSPDSERTAVDGDDTSVDPMATRMQTEPQRPPQASRMTPQPAQQASRITPSGRMTSQPGQQAPQPARAPTEQPARLPTPPPAGATPPQASRMPTPPPGQLMQPPARTTPPPGHLAPPTRTTPPPGQLMQPPARTTPPPGQLMQPPARTTPPPGSMRTPVPGLPGAVPIMPMNAGVLVSSSMSAPAPRPTPVPRTTPLSVDLPLPPPHAATPSPGMPYVPQIPNTPGGGQPVPVAVSYAQADVTERVRIPGRRATSETSFVHAPRKMSPIVWIAGLLVIGGGLAAVIALRGGGPPSTESAKTPAEMKMTPEPAAAPPAPEAAKPAAETPPAETKPADVVAPVETKPEPAPPVVPPVEAAKPAPEPAPAVAPPVETKPAPEPPPVAAAKPAVEPPKKPRPTAKPPAKIVKKVSRPEKKPAEPKPEPKEQKSWNADSPFMPVRTDKH